MAVDPTDGRLESLFMAHREAVRRYARRRGASVAQVADNPPSWAAISAPQYITAPGAARLLQVWDALRRGVPVQRLDNPGEGTSFSGLLRDALTPASDAELTRLLTNP
jgi:hypothetical protein